jgi:hypothetical protein
MCKILLFEINGTINEKDCNPDQIPNILTELTDEPEDGAIELIIKFPYYNDKISVYGWKNGNDIRINTNIHKIEKLNNSPIRLYGTYYLIRQDCKNNFINLSLDEYNNNIIPFLEKLDINDDILNSDIEEYENNIKYLESVQNYKNEESFQLKRYIKDNFI